MIGNRFINDGKEMIYLNDMQKDARDEFLEEYNKGELYHIEKYKCECGSDVADFDILAEKDRYGFPVHTVICRNCGLVMTNERMTQESYDYFYNHIFGRLYRNVAVEENVEKVFRGEIERGEEIFKFVKKNIDHAVERFLEIGCAAGGNLAWFANVGCEVVGIDLDDKYLSFGREKGLDLRQGHSSKLIEEGKKFDLIILNHVFEHFLDLEKELKVIQELLSDRGSVYIAVPGIKDLANGAYGYNLGAYLQNAHIRHFSLGTLNNIMEKYGFHLYCGNETIVSLFHYTGKRKKEFKNYYVDIMRILFYVENHYLNLQK